jgi:hypothetical protein
MRTEVAEASRGVVLTCMRVLRRPHLGCAGPMAPESGCARPTVVGSSDGDAWEEIWRETGAGGDPLRMARDRLAKVRERTERNCEGGF